MRMRVLSIAVLLTTLATLGFAHAAGPCTVATDSSTDANPGVFGYDPAVELTALQMDADATTLTIEWDVKDLSAPLPLLAQGRDYTLGWFVGNTGNHVTVSWTPSAGWTSSAGIASADTTANVVRATVHLSTFGLATRDGLTATP